VRARIVTPIWTSAITAGAAPDAVGASSRKNARTRSRWASSSAGTKSRCPVSATTIGTGTAVSTRVPGAGSKGIAEEYAEAASNEASWAAIVIVE